MKNIPKLFSNLDGIIFSQPISISNTSFQIIFKATQFKFAAPFYLYLFPERKMVLQKRQKGLNSSQDKIIILYGQTIIQYLCLCGCKKYSQVTIKLFIIKYVISTPGITRRTISLHQKIQKIYLFASMKKVTQ